MEPQDVHHFVFRIDLISIGNDSNALDKQHRKFVMAVEGKLRSLFVALETLGRNSCLKFRPYTPIKISNEDQKSS